MSYIVNESMASAPATGTIKDNAAWNAGGYLLLTPNANTQQGEFEYSQILPTSFQVDFDFYMGPNNPGADAIYFYFGCTSTPGTEDATVGGYLIALDEYNGDNEPVQIQFNGTRLANTTGGSTFSNSTYHHATILFTNGVFAVAIDGTTVLTFSDSSRDLPGTLFGWGARTGGVSNEHRIKNLLLKSTVVTTPATIGYNDTRTSNTPKSKYSWFLYINGQLYADITGIAENRQFKQIRNDSDEIDFSVSIDKANDYCSRLHTNISTLFQAGITEVRVYRYGVPLIAGELQNWSGQLADKRKLDFKAKGWFDLLKARRTSDSYTSQTAAFIVKDLLSKTLNKTNGSAGNYSGLQIGTTPNPDNTTVYPSQVYDQKTLYDAITEMSSDTNGFDFEVTWDKKLNVYYPHIGVARDDIVLVYPGNIKDFQPTVDATKLVNSLTGRGKGSGSDQLLTSPSPLTDSSSQTIYGLREDVYDYANVTDQTLLTNLSQTDLNIYKQPLPIYKVIFDGSGRTSAPQVGTFHIGDLIKVYINNFGLYTISTQSYMIDKIEVTIDDMNSEEVTITIADPNLAGTGV